MGWRDKTHSDSTKTRLTQYDAKKNHDFFFLYFPLKIRGIAHNNEMSTSEVKHFISGNGPVDHAENIEGKYVSCFWSPIIIVLSREHILSDE